MKNAYDEIYLNDAMMNFANCIEYSVNICGIYSDTFLRLFTASTCSTFFENVNPGYVCGISGIELVSKIINESHKDFVFPIYVR